MLKRLRRGWNDGRMETPPGEVRRVRASHEARLDLPHGEVSARMEALDLGVWAGSLFDGLGEPRCVQVDEGPWVFGTLLLHGRAALGRISVELSADGGGTALVATLVETARVADENQRIDAALSARMQAALEALVVALAAPSSPREPVPRREIRLSRGGIIAGDPDACFALACPVAELDWIDDWCFHLLRSESGRNEDDNIFLEAATGAIVYRDTRLDTCWYTVRYDRATRRFDAVLLTGEHIATTWRFACDATPDGHVDLQLEVVSRGLDDASSRGVRPSHLTLSGDHR